MPRSGRWRVGLFAAAASLGTAHRPTYVYAPDNCLAEVESEPSQVWYTSGSGGLVAIAEGQSWQIPSPPPVYFDPVVRDDIDPQTVSVYVGCGGCHTPLAALRQMPLARQGPVFEPFTQTVYHHLLLKADREVPTSSCQSRRMVMRLIDHMNRSAAARSRPVVWGAVVGTAEEFGVDDFVLMPLYIVLNHGRAWTEAGWTLFVLFLGGAAYVGFQLGWHDHRWKYAPYNAGPTTPWVALLFGFDMAAVTIAFVAYAVGLVEVLLHGALAVSKGADEIGSWMPLFVFTWHSLSFVAAWLVLLFPLLSCCRPLLGACLLSFLAVVSWPLGCGLMVGPIFLLVAAACHLSFACLCWVHGGVSFQSRDQGEVPWGTPVYERATPDSVCDLPLLVIQCAPGGAPESAHCA